MATSHMTDQPSKTHFFCRQIRTRIEDKTLTPGRAMVLGGDMIDEVELLLEFDYQVTLVDPTGRDLDLARQRGLSLTWAAKRSFMDVEPWHVGHLDLVVDRTSMDILLPRDRFAYANRMARFLPSGSFLAGLYRLGQGDETQPPYSLTRASFSRILGRYFICEQPTEFPEESQGVTSTAFHLLQRRTIPRRAPRPR